MFRRFLKSLIDYAICVYLILILAVMPFFNRNGYHYIGTDKSYFFNTVCTYIGRILVPAVLLYLIILLLKLKKEAFRILKASLSVTDLFAAGYCIALVVSYGFSRYRENALWGAAGWYMGLLPQLFLVAGYFFIAKLWKPRKWVFYLGLAASLAVFALGYLNRFGVDPLHMDIDVPGFISTIGNINWYCGYLVSVFFAGTTLLWLYDSPRPWGKLFLTLYAITGFGSLITQGSDSGILALGAVAVIMFLLSAPDGSRMKMFWLEMALLGCACTVTCYVRQSLSSETGSYSKSFGMLLTKGWFPFVMTTVSFFIFLLISSLQKRNRYPAKIFGLLAKSIMIVLSVSFVAVVALITVETRSPGSIGPLSKYSLFHFDPHWGSNRGATWRAGWNCFWAQEPLHKVIGVGPDSMSAYLYKDGSTQLLQQTREAFGDATLTNAHNEWLTVLVNLGILGLITYAGMLSTAAVRFLGSWNKGRRIVCACGMCLLAYTVNNIFSFQQAMSISTIFAMLGIGSAFLRIQAQSPESPQPAVTP